MEKENKKKTLTISSDLKKKIDTTSINTAGKKSFSVKKKEPFRGSKNTNRVNQNQNLTKNSDPKKKTFARKFVEQQATKAFIKKDDKPTGKSKLKLKGPIDKRDYQINRF
jgi:LAS superfamily LD-carboxypeptidase LdcB